MRVLVDTSIWIDYFGSGEHSAALDNLIDENLLVINDIILAELVPYLKIRKQIAVIQLLHEIKQIPLDINWEEIIEYQVKCLKNGASSVRTPDLIIAQNAMNNGCVVYTLDKHFSLLSRAIKLGLYQK